METRKPDSVLIGVSFRTNALSLRRSLQILHSLQTHVSSVALLANTAFPIITRQFFDRDFQQMFEKSIEVAFRAELSLAEAEMSRYQTLLKRLVA